MISINPYLNFNGNTEEAFHFYKSVFGGEFSVLMRNDSAPAEYPVPESDKDKIMHMALPLGNGTVLMGSDTLESMGQHLLTGNNFSITISTESEPETEKLFESLSVGGQVTMPLEKVFWGSYFGCLTDQYGIQWMVSYDYPQPVAADSTFSEQKAGV